MYKELGRSIRLKNILTSANWMHMFSLLDYFISLYICGKDLVVKFQLLKTVTLQKITLFQIESFSTYICTKDRKR